MTDIGKRSKKTWVRIPCQTLVTVYKAFIRSCIDHRDIIFDQTYNDSFHKKMESIQYNAALAIAGTIRRTFREKLCQELGLESLCKRWWYRTLC